MVTSYLRFPPVCLGCSSRHLQRSIGTAVDRTCSSNPRIRPTAWRRVPRLGYCCGLRGRCQRVRDNDEDYVRPADMLEELRKDNEFLVARTRETHALCDETGDLAGASLLENWIDEGERRVWFLFETTRHGARTPPSRRRGVKFGAATAIGRASFACRSASRIRPKRQCLLAPGLGPSGSSRRSTWRSLGRS